MAGKQARRLNDALRGEQSALEAYAHVIEAVGHKAYLKELKTIEAHHQQVIQKLEQLIISDTDGEPAADSGAWGVFANLITSAATAVGEESALRALKQGEEHGLTLYSEIADDRHIDKAVRNLMEKEFIPTQVRHISLLDVMIEQAAAAAS